MVIFVNEPIFRFTPPCVTFDGILGRKGLISRANSWTHVEECHARSDIQLFSSWEAAYSVGD